MLLILLATNDKATEKIPNESEKTHILFVANPNIIMAKTAYKAIAIRLLRLNDLTSS